MSTVGLCRGSHSILVVGRLGSSSLPTELRPEPSKVCTFNRLAKGRSSPAFENSCNASVPNYGTSESLNSRTPRFTPGSLPVPILESCRVRHLTRTTSIGTVRRLVRSGNFCPNFSLRRLSHRHRHGGRVRTRSSGARSQGNGHWPTRRLRGETRYPMMRRRRTYVPFSCGSGG